MLKPIFIAVIASVCCVSQVSAQHQTVAPPTLRLHQPQLGLLSNSVQRVGRGRLRRTPRVTMEILGGLVTAVGGVAAGMALGEAACQSPPDVWFACLGEVVLGGFAGGVSGIFAGVVIMGAVLGGDGSIPGALLGMALGGVAGGAAAIVLARMDAGLVGSVAPAMLLTLLGVIVGYEVTAESDENPEESNVALTIMPLLEGATLQLAGSW